MACFLVAGSAVFSDAKDIMTSTKDIVRSTFSERASEWAAAYSDPESRTLNMKNLKARQRFALQMVKAVLLPGSKILDVGCGPGEMAWKLMQHGYEVWGVDIAEPMIGFARERCGANRFRVGDIEQIPFPDSSFDGLICLGVLEYLDGDARALTEIERVLKPGGTAVLSTPSDSCPLYHVDRTLVAARPLLDLARYPLRGKPTPARPTVSYRRYRRGSWFRVLRSVGLEPQEWLCYGWGWYVSQRLGAFIERLSHVAALLWRIPARFLGLARLRRAEDRLARNPMLNWIAYEQMVRVRVSK